MEVSIHRKLDLLTLSLATMLLFAGALVVSPMDAQAADVENITGKLADLEADCAEERAEIGMEAGEGMMMDPEKDADIQEDLADLEADCAEKRADLEADLAEALMEEAEEAEEEEEDDDDDDKEDDED